MHHGCDLAYGPNDEGRCFLCGGSLPPRRRKYCSSEHHRLYSENHVWSAAKERALILAGGVCQVDRCEVSEWDAFLEVHHLWTKVRGRARYGTGCWNHQSRLLVACQGHHLNETRWERSKGRPVQLELVMGARQVPQRESVAG